MVLLVTNQYVGWGRGRAGRMVGGKLPVRGVGRQEVNQVRWDWGGGGEEEEEEETECSLQHCCHVSSTFLHCVFSKVSSKGLSPRRGKVRCTEEGGNEVQPAALLQRE